MDIVIPILTFIAGGVAGFAGGVYYLRKQMTNMSMDNKQIQQMARQMGVNLNQKQLNQMNKMMQSMNKKK
ncbi:YneF family protein [Tepidibacillus infernus]|uniref:YneF family protein n=1 Tax=Tepidibacillus decaturensis TaxID=1413211 RepID=A0A135L537_9BACI|nr:YneF family protein [Tepidibacillus decaturensis]KXG44108.1 hypothetical protein U473_08910 [Tepidibacillus decaturensis]